MHEAQQHEANNYLTLTYSPENLPLGGSLDHHHYQLFMKRVRKRTGVKMRYYMCGEYGEECDVCGRNRDRCVCLAFSPALGRPHYHALLFGYDYPDKVLWKVKRGNPLYRSALLEEDWGLGFCTIGNVTFQSAAYVARYVMKKQTGDPAQRHYVKVDRFTGETHMRLPEYNRMSLKPGIGGAWFDEFKQDVYPHDYCVLNGKRFKAPRYYDKLFKRLEGPEALEEIKAAREEAAIARAADSTPERLAARKKVAQARIGLLKRGFENE